MYCFAKLCRICLRQDRHMINILSVYEDKLSFRDMLSSVKSDMNAYQMSLPTWICTVCRKQLRRAYKFQRKCNKSFKILMNYLSLLKGINMENEAQKLATVELSDFSHQNVDKENISIKEENMEDAQEYQESLNIVVSPMKIKHSDSSEINIYSTSNIKEEINCLENSDYFASDHLNNELICNDKEDLKIEQDFDADDKLGEETLGMISPIKSEHFNDLFENNFYLNCDIKKKMNFPKNDCDLNSLTNNTDFVCNVKEDFKFEDISDAESESTVIFNANSNADKTNNDNDDLINVNQRDSEDVTVSKMNSSKNSLNDSVSDFSELNTKIKPIYNFLSNNNLEQIKSECNETEDSEFKNYDSLHSNIRNNSCEIDTNTVVQSVDDMINTNEHSGNTFQVSFNSDFNNPITSNNSSNFNKVNDDNTNKIDNNSSHNLYANSDSFWSNFSKKVSPSYYNEFTESNNTVCDIETFNVKFEQDLEDSIISNDKENNSQIFNSEKLVPIDETNLGNTIETIISHIKAENLQASVLPNQNHSTLNSDINSIIEIKDEPFTFELDFTGDNNSIDNKFKIDISDDNINRVTELPVDIKIENISENSDFNSKSDHINLEKVDDSLTINNTNLSLVNKNQYASEQQTRNEGVQVINVSPIVNINTNSDLEYISTIQQPESYKNSRDETNSTGVDITQTTNNIFVSNTILNTPNSISNPALVSHETKNMYNISNSVGNNEDILYNVPSYNLNSDDLTLNKSVPNSSHFNLITDNNIHLNNNLMNATDSTQNKSLSNSAHLNLNTNNNVHLNYNSTLNSSNINSNESPSHSKRRKIINADSKISSQFFIEGNTVHWTKQILKATGGNHSESEYTHNYIPSLSDEFTDEFIDIETHIRRQQILNLHNNSNNVPQNRNVHTYNVSNSILRERLAQHTTDLQNANTCLTMPSAGNHYSSVENSVMSSVAPVRTAVPYEALNENLSRIQPTASNIDKPNNIVGDNLRSYNIPMTISNCNPNSGSLSHTIRCSYTGNLINSHITGNKNYTNIVEKDGNISQLNKNHGYPTSFVNSGDYTQQSQTHRMFPKIITNPNPNGLSSNINQNLHKGLQPQKEYLVNNNKNHSNSNENQRSAINQETNIGLSVNSIQNSVSNNQIIQQKRNQCCKNINSPANVKKVNSTLDNPHEFFANIESVSIFLNTQVDGILEKENETLIFSIDNLKSLFSCKKCDQQFNCFDDLYNHSKEHISDFHYSTIVYRTKYLQEESYVSFEITKRLHQCKECGMKFHGKKSLMKHIWLHIAKITVSETNCNSTYDPNRPAKCAYCGKTYRSDTELQKHNRNVHQPKVPCKICKKLYPYKGLRSHKRIHNEGSFECDVCGKIFKHKFGLAIHKTIHTGTKPFPCSYCNKKFRIYSALMNHKRIHTGERPFECQVCKKCFTQQTSLQIHMRVHTGEKPYKCKDCGKCYSQSYVYKQHIKKHHSPSA